MTQCPKCGHYFTKEEWEKEKCDLCGKKVDLKISNSTKPSQKIIK